MGCHLITQPTLKPHNYGTLPSAFTLPISSNLFPLPRVEWHIDEEDFHGVEGHREDDLVRQHVLLQSKMAQSNTPSLNSSNRPGVKKKVRNPEADKSQREVEHKVDSLRIDKRPNLLVTGKANNTNPSVCFELHLH